MNLEWNGRNAEEESQDPLGVVRREEDLHFPVSLIVGDTKVVLVDEDMLRIDIEKRKIMWKIMWKILQDEVRLRD